MPAPRFYALLLALAAAACGTESHRVADASPEVGDEEAAVGTDAAITSADDAAVTTTPTTDGAAPTQMDAGGPGQMDAGSTSPAGDAAFTLPRDASSRLPDSAIQPCDFETDAGDSGCTGFVCSAEGGVYAALENPQHWYVGGLDWNGALCRRVLGWPSAMTTDTRYILYGLTARDQLEVDAGIPIFVYWGSGFEGPNARALRCSVTPPEDPLPACPATSTPPRHVSLQGCRSPGQAGCAVCTNFSAGWPSYRSAQPGSDYYNAVWPLQPAACAPNCPSCASCTLHDEQELKQKRRRECEPCPANVGIDPCFGGNTCDCYCSQFKYLASICPTFVD